VFCRDRQQNSVFLYNFCMPFSDSSPSPRQAKTPPADCTNQEAAYLKGLSESHRPVSIKLVDGGIVDGWIEYYDRNMLRLTRDGLPNLFIFKQQISYLAEKSST